MGATFGSCLPIPRDQSFADLLSKLDVDAEPFETSLRVQLPLQPSSKRSRLAGDALASRV